MVVKSADVAQRAGVSRATVSQILNGHSDRFAPETRAKVLQAATDLDYQPSVVGRALRRGSSEIVIALIPNTTLGGNLQDLFERITVDLAEQGFTLVLRMSSANPRMFEKLVVSLMPAAVMSLTRFTDLEREVLARHEVLAVEPSTASAHDRDWGIGKLQAKTLIASGYRRLAFAHLDDGRQDPFGGAREESVRATALAAGLDDIAVVRVSIDTDDAQRALAELNPPGIAVACFNDEVAAALLAAAHMAGLRVPEDVALIGMDRSPVSRITVPTLTTINYSRGEVAYGASMFLLAALGVGEAPSEGDVPLSVVPGGTI